MSIKSFADETRRMHNITIPVELNGGGGSDLPNVTADDNGNILAVVDGKWDKVDPNAPTPPIVVAEEQTVTPTSAEIGVLLTVSPADYDISSLGNGDILTVSVSGGEPVTTEIATDVGAWGANFYGDNTSANIEANESSIYITDDGFFGFTAGTPVTIEMSVTKTDIGNGDIFLVKFEMDGETGKLVADKGYDELAAASSNGKAIIGSIEGATLVFDSSNFVFTNYFIDTHGTGDAYIYCITPEYEGSYVPTGFWLQEMYTWTVTKVDL